MWKQVLKTFYFSIILIFVYYELKADSNLTMAELKEHLKNNGCEQIMQRMNSYAANITGSDSYW